MSRAKLSTTEYSAPVLLQKEEGLTLTDGVQEIRADFTKMLPRLKQSNLERELIVKACRIKGTERPVRVLDATAGFAEDSLLLAAAGFEVRLYEYDHVIASLMLDAFDRAKTIDSLQPVVARMEPLEGDSIKAMRELSGEMDVIFLDPMFPERQKSASVKKKFQLLQQLESPCSNELDMLEAALSTKAKKVVIKRPVKGEYLGGRKPDYSYSGKAIRYDVIQIRNEGL